MSDVTNVSMTADFESSSRLPPRRNLGLIFLLTAAIGFGWLWYRSYFRADALAFFDRSGVVHGVLSYRGSLVVASTSIQLGPDRAVSLKFIPLSMEEADWLYDKTFTQATVHKSDFHFGWSETAAGQLASMPDASWRSVTFPHWTVSIVCWLFLFRHLRRHTLRIEERRRRRRGQCLDCGYDLHGIVSEHCPECGRAVGGTAASVSSGGAPHGQAFGS